MADAINPMPGVTTAAGEEIHAHFRSTAYVDWAAVIGGTVIAMAVSFVLLTFGAAVGLSAVSPWTSTRTTVTAVSMGAAFWMILVNIWAFALGGYLAARMRHRHRGAQESEVHFRDGTHGALVWGLAVTLAATVAALSAAAIAQGGLQAGAAAVRNASVDPVGVATDALMRTNTANPNARTEDLKAEVTGILARSAAQGDVNAADRTYLAGLVAARAGIPQPEAERRVSETIAQMKQATDKTRKVAVVLGFVTAATLLLGAVAAWWGATTGGEHRDQGNVWHGFARHTSTFTLTRRGGL